MKRARLNNANFAMRKFRREKEMLYEEKINLIVQLEDAKKGLEDARVQ
jgi:hypothetical protein